MPPASLFAWRGRRSHAALVAVLATSTLLACDALTGLFEPNWEVAEANGKEGAFHFVMDSYARIGYPEHVRIERVESRTIKKPGGATEVQKRTRKVRVIMARCESKSICDAIPHSEDTRDVVVTGKMLGGTRLYVTAVVDESEELKDSIVIQAQ
jgi:hypothetical protein